MRHTTCNRQVTTHPARPCSLVKHASRAEPIESRSEPSRAEPSRAEPSRAEPSHACHHIALRCSTVLRIFAVQCSPAAHSLLNLRFLTDQPRRTSPPPPAAVPPIFRLLVVGARLIVGPLVLRHDLFVRACVPVRLICTRVCARARECEQGCACVRACVGVGDLPCSAFDLGERALRLQLQAAGNMPQDSGNVPQRACAARLRVAAAGDNAQRCRAVEYDAQCSHH